MKKWISSLAVLAALAGAFIPSSRATITNTTTRTVCSTGNGVTTNYVIGFPFADNDDIDVYLVTDATGAATQLTYGVGAGKFTITGGDPGTTVVMGTAPASTQHCVLARSAPRTQTVDYDENSAFPADDHEETMDKFAQILQELDYSASKSPIYDTPADGDVLKHNGSTWTLFDLDSALESALGVGTLISGPASSTDNAIPRFDGTTGVTLQNSNITISDAGVINVPGLTANTAVYVNGSGDLASSTVPATATPASTTDNAVVRWDGTTGAAIQNSGISISDAGALNIPSLTPNTVVYVNSSGNLASSTQSSVTTPTTTTDNAIVRWDGTIGSAVQNSAPTISDAGVITVPALTVNQAVYVDGSGALASSTQSVLAAATSTDNAIVTFEGTAGTQLRNSAPTISDAGIINVPSLTANAFVYADGSKNLGTSTPTVAASPLSVATKTAAYTLTDNDDVLFVSASAPGYVITLHDPTTAIKKEYKIIRTDNAPSNPISLDPTGAATIKGRSSVRMFTQYETAILIPDGTNWQVVSHKTDTPYNSWTPNLAGFGTETSVVGLWHRKDAFANVDVTFVTGTPSGEHQMPMPAGLYLDITGHAQSGIVGAAMSVKAAATFAHSYTSGRIASLWFDAGSVTNLFFVNGGESATWRKELDAGWVDASTSVKIQGYNIPIEGWDW